MSAFSWRCQYCSWAFQISSEAVVAALAAAEATQARHYVEQCPRCRKALKIPIDQLRHHAPLNVPAVTSAPIRQTSFKEDEKTMSDLPAPIPPNDPLIPIPPPAMPEEIPAPVTPAPVAPAPAAPAPAPKPVVVRKPAKKVVKKAVKKAAKKVVKKKAAKKPAKKTAKKPAKKAAKKAVKKPAKKAVKRVVKKAAKKKARK